MKDPRMKDFISNFIKVKTQTKTVAQEFKRIERNEQERIKYHQLKPKP